MRKLRTKKRKSGFHEQVLNQYDITFNETVEDFVRQRNLFQPNMTLDQMFETVFEDPRNLENFAAYLVKQLAYQLVFNEYSLDVNGSSKIKRTLH